MRVLVKKIMACCMMIMFFALMPFSIAKAASNQPNTNQPSNTSSQITFSGGSTLDFFARGDEGARIIWQEIDVQENQTHTLTSLQTIIVLIGVITAVCVVLVYGIMWVMATPQKKQQLKAGLVPLIIGVALLAIGPQITITLVEALLDIF